MPPLLLPPPPPQRWAWWDGARWRRRRHGGPHAVAAERVGARRPLSHQQSPARASRHAPGRRGRKGRRRRQAGLGRVQKAVPLEPGCPVPPPTAAAADVDQSGQARAATRVMPTRATLRGEHTVPWRPRGRPLRLGARPVPLGRRRVPSARTRAVAARRLVVWRLPGAACDDGPESSRKSSRASCRRARHAHTTSRATASARRRRSRMMVLAAAICGAWAPALRRRRAPPQQRDEHAHARTRRRATNRAAGPRLVSRCSCVVAPETHSKSSGRANEAGRFRGAFGAPRRTQRQSTHGPGDARRRGAVRPQQWRSGRVAVKRTSRRPRKLGPRPS